MSVQSTERFNPALPLHKAVWRSWSSMKIWVMVWLWYLNVVYWIGFAFVPRFEAQAVLVSYFAIGPLIVWTFVRLSVVE